MLTSIISAIGNNNSVYPLFIRDCGIENPTKVIMTYNQNKSDKYIAKNAVRERIIDEYATSAVWLGGIPLVGKICDKIINKKGFNPNISTDLLKGDGLQNLDLNIELFKDKAPQAVQDLLKIKNNKAQYQKLLGIKLLASILIPTLVMGFVLPKLNFGLTKKIMKNPDKQAQKFNYSVDINDFEKLITKKNSNKPSFKSNLFIALNKLTTVQKMAITDGGLSIGRVSTARNKNEALDNGIKMTGMMYLNYIAPKKIAKALDFFTEKIFKINPKLDPIILNDKSFISAIKEGSLKLPKSNEAKDILNFIDTNPKEIFTQLAKKVNLIKMIDEKTRDPRAFVDIKEMDKFINDIKDFSENAMSSGKIEQFAQKAKTAKCLNILLNVVISSFLLAFCLPKIQFFLRNLITKNKYEPGLINNQNKNSQT